MSMESIRLPRLGGSRVNWTDRSAGFDQKRARVAEADHELDHPECGRLAISAAVFTRKVKGVQRWQPHRLIFNEGFLQGIPQVQRILKQYQTGLLSPIVAIFGASIARRKTSQLQPFRFYRAARVPAIFKRQF